jgi:xylose isomerase
MINISEFFADLPDVRFGGPAAKSSFEYRYYDPDKIILGKRMEDHLRISVCLWHGLCWNGSDLFGGKTFERPWQRSHHSVNAAVELASRLGIPFLSFHDEDLLPFNHATPRAYFNAFKSVADSAAEKMATSGRGVLLATANLFSLPCFCSGAATSPDPDVFAFAAAKVKNMMDCARAMDAQNYVLWGGRDGYHSLLNTDLPRELDQLGRFVSMVVEYRHKSGYQGALLIEPKPCEPTKHQYDYDVATVYGFLAKYDLLGEVQVNIEANHATLAGHSFAHEVAYACAHGMLGSIDANRGDPQNGWDTDQFPNDIGELSHVLYLLLTNGGFGRGGFNFDARIRRDSTDLSDLLVAHIAAIDALAKGLEVAEKLIQDQFFTKLQVHRYQRWDQHSHPVVSQAVHDLDGMHDYVSAQERMPTVPSGHQEMTEQRFAAYLW